MKNFFSVTLVSLMVACGGSSVADANTAIDIELPNLTSILEKSKLCITDVDGTRDCTYSVDPDDKPFIVENIGSREPSISGFADTKTYIVDVTNDTAPCAVVRANSNHPILKDSPAADRTSYVSTQREHVYSDLAACKK